MKKTKILTTALFGISTILVPSMNCFSSVSCSSSVKSIDATDWKGVVNGKFFADSYTINEHDMTVTYNNSVGIRFLNLVIPNYVRHNMKKYKVLLGPQCFQENLWLVGRLELNDFIDEIPSQCFYGCHNLESVIFHKYPKKIGDLAFSSTPVEDIYVKIGKKLDNRWYLQLESIGEMAFYASWIKGDLIFGKDLYYMGIYAFGDCFAITSLNMKYAININAIPEGAFEGCTGLSSVQLPETIVSIDESAFQMCTTLMRVILPNDQMRISLGNYAFYSCIAFRGFSRDLTITHIGDACFYQNNALEMQFWLNQYGVQTIGRDAFQLCAISSVSFDPNSLTDVEDAAFAYCSNLCSIDFSQYTNEMGPPKWHGRDVFYDISETGVIYVNPIFTFTEDWQNFFIRQQLNIEQGKWKIIKVVPQH